MTITFSRNKSEKNKFAKDLLQLYQITGTLREGSSVTDPVIMVYGLDQTVVVGGASYNLLSNINYAYIPAFGRKYFVTDIKTDANGLFIVSMHVDVLSTYHDDIAQQTAVIKRQENQWNLYLDDGTLKTYQNPIVEIKTFGSGFNTQSYVFAVAGSN